jgi:drug/metabolite transporter (DMT)-like permease
MSDLELSGLDPADGRSPSKAFMPVAWVLLPLFVTAHQIVAKWLATELETGLGHHASWLLMIVSSPSFALIVLLEIGSFAIWMYLLARMPLSQAFPLSAISYVFVVVASWTIFNETGSVAQVMGSAAIIMGAWLIGRSPKAEP